MKFCNILLLTVALAISVSARPQIVTEDWDEIEYENYETIETYIPQAYPLEHVDVY